MGYFLHEEAKSFGETGVLDRMAVIGLDKEWIGKETHPLRDEDENPDNDALNELEACVPILREDFNSKVVRKAGVEAVAKATRIPSEKLKSLISHGRKPSSEEIAKIRCALFARQDGSIQVREVLKTREETKAQKVAAALIKCGRFEEIARIIDPDSPMVSLYMVDRPKVLHDVVSLAACEGNLPDMMLRGTGKLTPTDGKMRFGTPIDTICARL
jgi:hypothetical protein